MELYFASGTLIDPEAIRRWCPGARPRGHGSATGCKIGFPRKDAKGNGIPALIAEENATAPGTLWSLTREQLRALDDGLGVPEAYRRKRMMASYSGGSAARVWVHVACPEEGAPFSPSEAMLQRMSELAEALDLPSAFKQELRRAASE